ncbi:hypothetical protein [Agromyces archimandritae]|uniref:Uncharacterized protein n=1 Tax=Agromyces archimandritae TaxID=2781962 RepID=A0A975FK31_9MICO|nr:hypothetical protein [Agromyces archimandritae]QTX03434.1 hypothetical protein G127AT_08630 [Agromyces archimandritae]
MSRTVRDRALKTFFVAAGLAVIAAIALFPDAIARVLVRLPDPGGSPYAGPAIIALVVVLVPLVFFIRLGRLGRSAAAFRTLERAGGGVTAGARRTRSLLAAVSELYGGDAKALGVRIGIRFVLRAEAEGVGFWAGGRKPKRLLLVPWDEVRTIRSDTMAIGDRSVPVMLLRVRHAGASLELPVLLASHARASAIPLRGEAFFQVVRAFKAKQRAHLVAGGLAWEEALQVAPITAPIPIIKGQRPTLAERRAFAAAAPAAE